MRTSYKTCALLLEDESIYEGSSFGFPRPIAGEVVFNTGMVGYPEAFTDPSYKGQILVLTYPLVGNYGMPSSQLVSGLDVAFESERAQIAGLIVSEAAAEYSHWNATKSLPHWLYEHEVPALAGIDTRALTKQLREKGCMLGKIQINGQDTEWHDPNRGNLVSFVSVKQPVVYPGGRKRVVVIDCGCKHMIIRSFLARGVNVVRVPWDFNFLNEEFDGILVSNGPGDPKMCSSAIVHLRKAMERNVPILGLCLGHQLLALAAGADTYKLKFGHRGQNQPCVEAGTKRCYITSQNHGYAVDSFTLPPDWEPWFTNANDGSNEGIRHRSSPFMGVQFHPEASPGPVDTNFIFDEFLALL